MSDGFLPHAVVSLDASSFSGFAQHGVVLVDFSEPWCGPCHIQLPILERVAERVQRHATIGLVNVDEAPGLAARFHLEAIPTLLLFKEGQLIRRFVGVHSETSLTDAILTAAEAPTIDPPPVA